MDRPITKSTTERSLSTSSPKYSSTKTVTTTDGPINPSLYSVQQIATADSPRGHTISTDNIDPLLLNGLTDHENELNLMEKINADHLLMIDNTEQSINLEENKPECSIEQDRIQTNSSINSQTIE
jgi:hypothetical protein